MEKIKKELYTIATFDVEADAHVVRAKLESEGIPTFIWEENRTYANPTQGTSLSGIKLQVYAANRDRARAIYEAIRSYARDEKGNPITCPNCKAQKSEIYYGSKGLLFKLFPFLEKKKYRCLNCQMITRP